MEILNIVIKIVGLLFLALGVIMIYDARKISEKRFSFQDRNSSTKILKIAGLGISVLGAIIVIININF